MARVVSALVLMLVAAVSLAAAQSEADDALQKGAAISLSFLYCQEDGAANLDRPNMAMDLFAAASRLVSKEKLTTALGKIRA